MLTHEVEKSVWMNIKNNGQGRYYSKEDLEDFDMFFSYPGWGYSVGAINWAMENGFDVYIDNQKIKQ